MEKLELEHRAYKSYDNQIANKIIGIFNSIMINGREANKELLKLLLLIDVADQSV